MEKRIKELVHHYYWVDDVNCAITTLRCLADFYKVEIHPQVIDSAIGMHGAGGYRAQCGLVEGTLLFIGIYYKSKGFDSSKIAEFCSAFAQGFEAESSSLLCRDIRPGGFQETDPPHLCEDITVRAINWTIGFLEKI